MKTAKLMMFAIILLLTAFVCACGSDDDSGEGEGEGESEGEGEGEPAGNCKTDADCANLRPQLLERFLHFENVYCDLVYEETGMGECRECKEDSDCSDKGSFCVHEIYCVLPNYCETAQDCNPTNPYYHDGCSIEGICGPCVDSSTCLQEEICYIWQYPNTDEEDFGQCVDADKVDRRCIDKTCENDCELTNDESGKHNGIICPDDIINQAGQHKR